MKALVRFCMFLAAMAVACVAPSCSTEAPPVGGDGPTEESAKALLETLTKRFPGVIADGHTGTSSLRVTLPRDARGELLVEEPASGVGAHVALVGARRGERVDRGGLSVFPSSGVVMRESPEGVEDFVQLETEPSGGGVDYRLSLAEGTHLRLVSTSLELLDRSGTPRIRMTPPWLVDATGQRRDVRVSIEGCAYDASLAPPWGRPTTAPLARECTLHLTWERAAYPALLDPAWTTTGSLAIVRDRHTALRLASGRVLVMYGIRCFPPCAPSPPATEIYDPATKTFASSGSPNDRTANAPGIGLANGKALVLGSDGGQLWDPATGLVTLVASSGRSGGAALAQLGSGKVLAVGGSAAATAELYDPATNLFTATPNTPKVNRNGLAATVLASGKVLLSGGGTDTAEIYDPALGTFTATGSMTMARTGHGAHLLPNGKVLVVGGARTKVAELYDPATGQFTETGSLVEQRTEVTSTILTSGTVYVVGGFFATGGGFEGTASPIVERYDPTTAKFTLAPTLERARGAHRLNLLPSGAVLATGGRDFANETYAGSIGVAEELSVLPPGAACVVGDDCATGLCDFGVCCAAPCTGSCQSCVAGTGACVAVKSADDPSSCTGTQTCDATGACKKKPGQSCTSAADCASTYCVDGVCCDRACNGTCEACNGIVPGRCDTIAGVPRGTRTCAGLGTTCGGACDGAVADRCTFPGEATGCGTKCEGSTRTAGSCDGKGACIGLPPRPCPGNYACADAESCRTTCAKDDECARGFGCTAGKCTPVATCDGDHTVIGADGKSKTDCTPFRCDMATNVCLTSCQDVAGCADPFLCDGAGQCISAPRAPSGCAVTAVPAAGARPLGPATMALLGLSLLAARRRRARLQRADRPVR